METKVTAIPAFRDNYIWCIHNQRFAVVIDPGDAQPVLAFIKQTELRLLAILCTHHHADHVGGNSEILKHFAVPVYGPRNEAITTVTHPLIENAMAIIPELSLELSVLDIPGHTRGHIAYYNYRSKMLFCGDTLFSCGCGKLFEGTPTQMYNSLQKLSHLPDDINVYCGHEYTLSNIRFAKHIDPHNKALLEREQWANEKRLRHLPTLPSNIGVEKLINPFLRCEEHSIINAAAQYAKKSPNGPVEVFAIIRDWKDNYL